MTKNNSYRFQLKKDEEGDYKEVGPARVLEFEDEQRSPLVHHDASFSSSVTYRSFLCIGPKLYSVWPLTFHIFLPLIFSVSTFDLPDLLLIVKKNEYLSIVMIEVVHEERCLPFAKLEM